MYLYHTFDSDMITCIHLLGIHELYLQRDCRQISRVGSSFLHLEKEGLNSERGEEVEKTRTEILMSRGLHDQRDSHSIMVTEGCPGEGSGVF